MDRSKPVSQHQPQSRQTAEPPQPLEIAATKITALTAGRTTVEQLAALAYAWGSGTSGVSGHYKKTFEECKSTFLAKASNEYGTLNATQIFNKYIRAKIREQLPINLCIELESTLMNFEKKLSSDNNYGYPKMKLEMIAAIKVLIAKTSAQTLRSDYAAPTTTTASLPPSSVSSTTPTFVSPLPAHGATPVVISPLVAPPQLEFLNSFPAEWRSRPAWINVIASMDKYMSSFSSYRGSAQKTLLQQYPGELVKIIQSFQLHTALPAEEAEKVAYQREIVNIAMEAPFKSVNQSILGYKTSRMMQSETAQSPGNQLSLSMRVPMLTKEAKMCCPVILSVSGPALDEASQPEWKHYVENGKLNVDAYKVSYQTLAGHIKQCAALPEIKGAQVVLSGFGLANFLNGLAYADKEAAISIGAGVLTDLIRELRADGISVAFTGISTQTPPWPAVNAALGKEQINCIGSIPGNWITDNTIIVNAWDPHALVGNGCANDQSLDGYVGRNSLVHEAHALACMLYANGFKV